MRKGTKLVFLSVLIIFLIHFLDAQSGPLSHAQIEGLIKLNAPDSTVSKEITQRGLSFIPNRQILDDFRKLGAGPLTLDVIKGLIPFLEEAKKVLPEIVTRIYKALNEGNPQSAALWLSPRILSNPSQLDRICQPSSYRAHYIETISERPRQGVNSRMIEVSLRVLFSPLEEKCHIMIFSEQGDGLILQRLSSDARNGFRGYEETAKQMAKEFFYALRSNDQSRLKSLVSNAAIIPASDPKFISYMQSLRDFAYEVTTIIDSYYGLKCQIQARARAPMSKWDFYFDKINDEIKIVKWKVTVSAFERLTRKPNWGGEDSNMESYTLRRFGL